MWHQNHLLPLSDPLRVPQMSRSPSPKPTSPKTRSQRQAPTPTVLPEEEEDYEEEEYGEEIVTYRTWLTETETDAGTTDVRGGLEPTKTIGKSLSPEVEILLSFREADRIKVESTSPTSEKETTDLISFVDEPLLLPEPDCPSEAEVPCMGEENGRCEIPNSELVEINELFPLQVLSLQLLIPPGVTQF